MAYIEPTRADVRMRYPSFAAVDDAVIDYWLVDAHRHVDLSWSDVDYSAALVAAACHAMLNAQVSGLVDSDFASLLANGVTDFQSGGREGFRASFSADAIKNALSGGYETTRPGQEYLRLLARNKGGPRVTPAGAIPISYGLYAGMADGLLGFVGPYE